MHKGASVLQAKQEAYGGSLDRKQVFRIIAPYGIITFAFSLLLFWSSAHFLWVIILTLLSLIMGYIILVPPSVSINYYRSGLEQRHLFINSMTQAISSKSETMIHALHLAQFGLHGEFKQDMSRLESTLEHNGPHDIAPVISFSKIRKKYHEDSYFCQYMEQLQSGFQTGNMDQRTCDDIEKFHNALFDEQRDYAQKRRSRMHGEFFFIGLMGIMYAVIVFSFGWHNYENVFAFNLIGHVISLIYLFILLVPALGLAYKYDHDESLMTM